jgi:hypothetical protein
MPISDRELEHIRRKQREFLDVLLVRKWTTPRRPLGEQDTWLDEEALLPDQDWDVEIRKAIERSCAVIVFLSARTQKRGYIQKEIARVLDESDRQSEGTIFLIPAKLEPCEVPDRLSRWQWVDLASPAGFKRLCKALATHRVKRT